MYGAPRSYNQSKTLPILGSSICPAPAEQPLAQADSRPLESTLVIKAPASQLYKPLFGFTILLSACLLFEIQPIIAKTILPWSGGGAVVWTTSLLFFQVVLL